MAAVAPQPITFDVDEVVYDVVAVPASALALGADLDGERVEMVYKRVAGAWEPWVVATRSALLRRMGLPGRGVFAARRFRGPSNAGLAARRGETIGRYQEAAHAIARDADPARVAAAGRYWAERGRDKLLTIRLEGQHVLLDGDSPRQGPFPPWFSVNDARNSGRSNNVEVVESGVIRALRAIEAVDFDARGLDDWIAAELSFDYGAAFWREADRGSRGDKPLVVPDAPPKTLSMVHQVVARHLAAMQISTAAAKRARDDALERAPTLADQLRALAADGDVEAAMGLLNEATRTLDALQAAGDEHSETMADDLQAWARGTVEEARVFLADQCRDKLVVWDVESDHPVPTHGSGIKLEDLRVTILAALVVDADAAAADPAAALAAAERYEFWHPDVDGAPLELFQHCLEACKAHVAYNGVAFDMVLIKRHYDDPSAWERHVAAMIDPLVDIRSATGRRFKLDALLRANGLPGKLEAGVEAPAMFARRELDRLRRYCFDDVEKLAALALRPSITLPDVARGVARVESRVHALVVGSGGGDPARVAQRSPEWFALRRNRVTSTLVGAILGVSSFHSRDDAHELLRGELDEAPETAAMRAGIAREAEALRRYAAATGNAVEEVGFVVPKDARYSEWTGASPDGLGRDDGGLCVEVKVPASGRPAPKPTEAYYLQCQWHLFCTRRARCDFVSLGRYAMTVVTINRDDDLLRFILPLLRTFWENAQRDDFLALEPIERVQLKRELADSMDSNVGPTRVARF
jgi:putative phage-type endonuclease